MSKLLCVEISRTAIPAKRDDVLRLQGFRYHISQCATDEFSILLLRHKDLLLSYK